MAKSDIKVNFRIPEALRDSLHAFALEHDITLSEACRVLLNTSLINDETRAAADEMVYAFGAARARIARRILEKTSAIMKDIIAEEFGGDVP